MQRKPLLVIVSILIFSSSVFVLADNELHIRVVDVGAGHCAIMKMPNGEYVVFDTGREYKSINHIKSFMEDDKEIELMILSHGDGDHIEDAINILETFKVKKILRTGMERTSEDWKDLNEEIIRKHYTKELEDLNLRYITIEHGTEFKFGEVTITLIAGWHRPPGEWGLSPYNRRERGDYNNSNSLVIRLDYKNKSVLFTGDEYGRKQYSSPESIPIASEKFMIDNMNKTGRKIDVDVIIAGHHGANDSSSSDFIKYVSPEYVIFPSGGKYSHPTKDTAKRYNYHNVPFKNMYRTDLEDKEKDNEFKRGSKKKYSDEDGDDHIDIIITQIGELVVRYADKKNQEYWESLPN